MSPGWTKARLFCLLATLLLASLTACQGAEKPLCLSLKLQQYAHPVQLGLQAAGLPGLKVSLDGQAVPEEPLGCCNLRRPLLKPGRFTARAVAYDPGTGERLERTLDYFVPGFAVDVSEPLFVPDGVKRLRITVTTRLPCEARVILASAYARLDLATVFTGKLLPGVPFEFTWDGRLDRKLLWVDKAGFARPGPYEVRVEPLNEADLTTTVRYVAKFRLDQTTDENWLLFQSGKLESGDYPLDVTTPYLWRQRECPDASDGECRVSPKGRSLTMKFFGHRVAIAYTRMKGGGPVLVLIGGLPVGFFNCGPLGLGRPPHLWRSPWYPADYHYLRLVPLFGEANVDAILLWPERPDPTRIRYAPEVQPGRKLIPLVAGSLELVVVLSLAGAVLVSSLKARRASRRRRS